MQRGIDDKMWTSKRVKLIGFMVVLTALSGCQSSGSTKQKSGSMKPKNQQERPLNVIRSRDGIQDITWEIKSIQGKPARFYGQMPSLRFNSQNKSIQGHTGCNQIRGHYVLDVSKKTVDLEAKSGYYSCDNALVQEAELADALKSAQTFRLSGQQFSLLDARGRVVIQAVQK